MNRMTMHIHDIVTLSELLGEMANIKRATKLPNDEFEPDSHHAFSLALIAYQICMSEKLDLDANKVVFYALAHDLLEIITGDEDTLYATPEQLAAKRAREKEVEKEFDILFANYPELKGALYEYEKLDTPEAATVFVLDKACTTWTHHADNGSHARTKGLHKKEHIEKWAKSKREAFERRLNVKPPERILEIYEESFEALKGLYDD